MSEQNKHIAFVVKYFPVVSETFIVNQINGIIDAGFTVDLYAYVKVENTLIHKSLKKHNLLDKVTYFIKPPNTKIKRITYFFKWLFNNFSTIKWNLLFKTLNFLKHGKEAYTLKLFFEAQWFLVPYDFKLIHAHFGINGNRLAKLKAKGIIPNTVKFINTFHGYDLSPDKLAVYPKEYRNLFKEVNAFTVNTPYLENLLKQVNVLNKPCYVLPVGLDTAYFKREQGKVDSTFFDIVFCGKLMDLKGPDTAVLIVKKLVELDYTNVRLHIIGDGPMEDELELFVQNNNLKENVFFYGKLSQEDVKLRLQQSDVFLLPGRYDKQTKRADTQGLVVQEAQAMSLPAIVSDVGGIKYGVLQNKSGFVIPENDLDGFVEAIVKLILNPKLKMELGNNGRSFVVENYDNKVLADALQLIYSDVTAF